VKSQKVEFGVCLLIKVAAGLVDGVFEKKL
jgi:hypothetical protein